MRILIIEDDKGISQVLKRGLEAHSHQIVIAARGEEGLDLATDETIELVLLDISLPGLNGHQVLEQLRARRPRMPVIMLTARDDLKNKIAALHAGADDYLTKPFAFEELLARIQAVMRRFDQPESARLQAGTLQLDLLAQRAWRNDNLIALSKREFALLEYFMRHPQQVLSREQILLGIWGYDFDTASNIVDVYVRQLRNKIDEPNQPSLIATVR
ncbi:MAG: response regulator transcription factor, partial [Caldilineaceae bacterium]|nr:response regulator transcription factor [Caldilineaceae bacterium]